MCGLLKLIHYGMSWDLDLPLLSAPAARQELFSICYTARLIWETEA